MHSHKKVKADVVTDEQGRRRFHGAFTGGFSAGHFNTVGSVEGWTPKTFVSSRSQRAPRMEQRVQDLMDSEDGFLGGVLATKEEYDTFGTSQKQQMSALASKSALGSAIPGPMPEELIVASSNGIGQSLLKLMGWREGQGVGRRRVAAEVPDGIDVSRLPQGALEQNDIAGINEHVVTFASSHTNSCSTLPTPKTDMCGLGYDRRSAHPEMAAYLSARGGDMTSTEFHSNVYRVSSLFGDDKKAARSHVYSGFAVDDDDDSGLFDGDTAVADLPAWQEKSSEATDRAMSAAAAVASRQRCATDGRPPLQGFALALQAADAFTAPSFLPPLVPDGFKPRGAPPPLLDQSQDAKTALRDEKSLAFITEPERNKGSSSSNSSVFSMLGAEAKERILQSIRNTAADTPELREKLQQTPTAPPLVASSGAAPAFVGMAQALQSRFAPSGKTSDEATKVASAPRVSRFEQEGLHHPASLPPEETAEKKPREMTRAQDVPQRILPPTRTTVAWLPARLLSKRMNVAVPSISPDLALHTSVSSVTVNNAAGGAAVTAPTKAREEIIFDEHIRKYAGDQLFSTALNTSDSSDHAEVPSVSTHGKLDVEPTVGTGGDVVVRPEDVLLPPRPPISLFKSIFEDSSDDSDDESEDEGSKLEPAKESVQPDVPSAVINEDIFRRKPEKPRAPNKLSNITHIEMQVTESENDRSTNDGKIIFNKPLSSKREASTAVNQASNQPKRKKIVVALEEDEEEGLTIRPCNARPHKSSSKLAPPDRKEVDEAIHHLSANKHQTKATIGKIASLLQSGDSTDSSSQKRKKKESKKKSKKHKNDKKKSKKKNRQYSDDSDSSSSD